jgi:hypothetical protein
MILGVGSEKWRKPIKADAEQTYAFHTRGSGDVDIRWTVDGDPEELMHRFGNGLACSQCCEVFPARPCLENLTLFANYGNPAMPSEIRDAQKQRIANGCCPMCGSEVSPEMFAATFEGIQES